MIKSKVKHVCYSLLGCALMISVSKAGDYSISGTVTAIGCQTVDHVCYVTLSGAASGPSGCVLNGVRWDSSSPNGTAAIAQLTAAYLAGKQVFINMDNTCFVPGSPLLDYYVISG